MQDDISELTALERVFSIVRNGRISEGRHGSHYCWHTVFKDGVCVSTRDKRHSNAADSFVVTHD